jgi:hypothetical protein
MATIKCSACLNDFEIEIPDSLKSIQCLISINVIKSAARLVVSKISIEL